MSQEMPGQNHHRLLNTVCQAGRSWHFEYSTNTALWFSMSKNMNVSFLRHHLHTFLIYRMTAYQAPFTLGSRCVSSPVKPTLCPKWWSCCWCMWSWMASTRRVFTASQAQPVGRGSSIRFWRLVRKSSHTSWNFNCTKSCLRDPLNPLSYSLLTG